MNTIINESKLRPVLPEIQTLACRYINNDNDMPAELKIALQRPENLDNFMKYLTGQWYVWCDRKMKNGVKLDQSAMKTFVNNSMPILVMGLIAKADRMKRSDLENSRREKEIADQQAKEDALEGKITGEYADMGLITDDETVQELINNDTSKKVH